MVYLDNSATSFRKPQAVYKAALNAMRTCSSAGRGSYHMSELAAQKLFDCRSELALLYGIDEPERIAFASNATVTLNMAIKGIIERDVHAVTSGYEHNAVMRPLTALARQGVTFTSASSPLFDREAAYDGVKKAIKPETALVIVNHISNVFGFIQPIEQIDELCSKRGIPMIIDASQSAGIVKIDASKLKATAYICMPGHKGLYGPQGTGAIIACGAVDNLPKRSIIEGGTGSDSASFIQPSFMPDMLESGTHNICGIAGLTEGIRFVLHEGCDNILKHEAGLCAMCAKRLESIDGLKVFYDSTWSSQAGVLSFVYPEMDCTHMAALLAAGGFCVRAGHHCAPLAHRSAGTFETGTVRMSPSIFTTAKEIERFSEAVRIIVQNAQG